MNSVMDCSKKIIPFGGYTYAQIFAHSYGLLLEAGSDAYTWRVTPDMRLVLVKCPSSESS